MPVLILFFLIVLPAYGYEEALGWNWYNIQKLSSKQHSEEDPLVQMQALRTMIKRTLYRAILEPSEDHLIDYIQLQNRVSAQSSLFSKIWKQALLAHPDLNYALIEPTSQLAQAIHKDQVELLEEQKIKIWARTHGLIFFYRSSCPYSRSFAPILKHWAGSHGISILAVTTDQVVLNEFPQSLMDQGQAKKLGVQVEPALFVVDLNQQKLSPLSYGFMTEEELNQALIRVYKEAPDGIEISHSLLENR